MNDKSSNKIIRDYRHVNILNKINLFNGFFKIDKYVFQFCKYDGSWIDPIEREVFERGSGAAVLLYDPDLDKVILIEQLRIGALDQMEKKGSPWLIEVVAGIIENTSFPEETIIKETKEETGLSINQFIKIAEYYVSPGGSTEKIYLFCAKISAVNVKGIFGLDAECEDIQIIVMDCEAAYSAVSSGKINNASAIIALQWLQINQKNLKNQWKS